MKKNRLCLFCRQSFPPAIKAVEHVLRKSWLETLKLSKIETTYKTYNKDGFLNQKKFAAQAILVGEICKSCNNGWMDSLDRRVENIILGLASTSTPNIKITAEDSFHLARWVLKVACVYEGITHASRRHIPEEILMQMHKPDYLPEGFIAFTASIPPEKHSTSIGIGIFDMWDESLRPTLSSMDQSTRLKFVVGYNNLIIGCSYILNTAPPIFIGISGIHDLIYANKATLSLNEEIPVIDALSFPEGVEGDRLEIAALTLSVSL